MFNAQRTKPLPKQETEMQHTALYNGILKVIIIHKTQLCLLSQGIAHTFCPALLGLLADFISIPVRLINLC